MAINIIIETRKTVTLSLEQIESIHEILLNKKIVGKRTPVEKILESVLEYIVTTITKTPLEELISPTPEANHSIKKINDKYPVLYFFGFSGISVIFQTERDKEIDFL